MPRLETQTRRGERGAALVAAALTLLLISVLAATFLATITGERSISSNVHVAKGSLYAADAGIRTAQQVLANTARTRLDSLASFYPGTGMLIPTPTTFFPGGSIVTTSTNPRYTATATVAFADTELTPQSQTFDFRYTIVSSGNNGVVGARTVQSSGILRVSAERGSFADYLIFTNEHQMGNGADIWFTSSGYFDGRVHTNTKVRIAYQPTFEDLLSSHDRRADYYNRGNPVSLDANYNGTYDVPNLYGGFTRNSPVIPLPNNSYSQQNASLGRDPANLSNPSNYEIRYQIPELPDNSNSVPDGIYFPRSGSTLSGGIYVSGNLSQCVVSIDSLGRQVYTMRQGSATSVVTVDRSTNSTIVFDGTSTNSYTGVPNGMLYAKGQIQSLGGPPRDVNGNIVPALADGTRMLVAASSDITLQSDLTYRNYDTGQSVLGIFASNGDVHVGTGAPDDMHLDAYVMASGSNGELRVDNYNSGEPRGTFYLRGGMVTDRYGAFYTFDNNGDLNTGFARNFRYDRRGMIPPYYPTTSQFNPDEPSARTVAWKEL